MISVSIVTTAMSLSMFTHKMLILLQVYMEIKKKKIWELVIKDSCLDMPLMNGMIPYYIHTLMFFQIKFAKKWQYKERMVRSHG
jgi:hypothetical protein